MLQFATAKHFSIRAHASMQVKSNAATNVTAPSENLAGGLLSTCIFFIRMHRVLLDSDLAELYGVPTKVLVQAVKRNIERFPSDFMFQLTENEWNTLRSQSVTSNAGRGGRRYPPYAFTEQGVAMLSSVLSSQQAIAANIEIMRAFVRLRGLVMSNQELATRLDQLENDTELIALKHDTFEQNTRVQLKQIFDALRELMAPPDPPRKRPIGFITPTESKSK